MKMWVLMVKLMKKYHWSSPTLWGRDYTPFWGPKLQSQPAVFAVWLILISKTFTFFTFASSLLFSLQLPCDCQPGAGDVTVAFDLDRCRYFCTNFSRNLPEVHNRPEREKWDGSHSCPGLHYMSWLYACPCSVRTQHRPHYRQLSLEGHTSSV